MPVAHWDPVRELLSLRQRMNRLIEQTLARSQSDLSSGAATWSPVVDLYESDADLVLTAELPEIELEDIELRLDDDRLTLRGERKLHANVDEQQFQRMERSYGPFTRSFALPVAVDKNSVKAELKHGVLKVTLPKKSDAGGHQIQIST